MSIELASVLLFILIKFVLNSNAANILGLFPIPSYSHQQPFLKLSYALAGKGHNLTILTTNPSKKPIKNVREIDLSSLYDDWANMQRSGVMSLQESMNPRQALWEFYTGTEYMTEVILNKPIFKKFMREVNGSKFDLILVEGYPYTGLLGIRELIGRPPFIGIGTAHPYPETEIPTGNPTNPSYIPSVLFDYDDRMTLWERLNNAYLCLYSKYILYWYVYPMSQRLLTRHFGSLPYTAEELERNRSLLIVSVDLITGYPRPLQPNTVFVGPLHVESTGKPQPLPQDLQKWMDGAEDGVIYFSLGSNMKGTSVPEHIRAEFINAFKRLPKVRVLWKWEADTKLPGQPDNVLVRKWLPQKSILEHPNLKVFISQCGLQSIQEAIDKAVPILGVPLFADQFYNMKRLITNGVGLKLSFNEITQNDVYHKLKDLITDPSYKSNMLRISALTKDKPMTAIDSAIWWVEYVLRHNGAPHLRPASLDLTWYQYYMVDILLIVLIIILITSYIFYYIINRMIKLLPLYNLSKNIKVKKQ